MVLEWTPEEASLLQDRPFSAAASVYISSEAWETQNHQHQSTGYLRTRGQETLYETCACVIHTNLQLHYYSTMRHSMIDLSLFNTSEESLRDLLGTRAPRDRRSECMIKLVLVHVSFTFIYTACASSYINVCAGCMCFVKL